MRDLHPVLPSNPTSADFYRWIEEVTRSRNGDLDDFNAQQRENPRIFDAPSSSTDTIGTEKVGDIAADSGFLYVVVDNAGILEWRRVAISSF
jgi:hypothetical protein